MSPCLRCYFEWKTSVGNKLWSLFFGQPTRYHFCVVSGILVSYLKQHGASICIFFRSRAMLLDKTRGLKMLYILMSINLYKRSLFFHFLCILHFFHRRYCIFEIIHSRKPLESAPTRAYAIHDVILFICGCLGMLTFRNNVRFYIVLHCTWYRNSSLAFS